MGIKLNVYSVIWFTQNPRGMFSRILNIKLCLDLLCNNLGDAEDLEAVEWQNIYLERDSMPYFTIAENISFNTNNILE